MTPQNDLPPDIALHRVFDAKQAAAFIGLPLPSFRRGYRAGSLPKPIQLTERRLGWRAGDLVAWLESRAGKEAA